MNRYFIIITPFIITFNPKPPPLREIRIIALLTYMDIVDKVDVFHPYVFFRELSQLFDQQKFCHMFRKYTCMNCNNHYDEYMLENISA